MRKAALRVMSALVAVAILTAIIPLSSCSKNDDPGLEIVAADTPWYDCTEITVGSEYDDIGFNRGMVVSSVIGTTDEGYVYGIQGTSGGYEEDQKQIFDICLYDKEGSLISKTDIADIIDREISDDGFSYPYIYDSVYIEDNDIKISYINYLNDSFTIATLDRDNNTLKDQITYGSPSGWNWSEETVYRTICGDNTIYVSYDHSSVENSVKLLVMGKDGSMTVADLKESNPADNPGYIYEPIPVNDHQLLLLDVNTEKKYLFDVDAMKLEYEKTGLSWLDDLLVEGNTWSVADDGGLYVLTPSEICRVDWDKKEAVSVTLLENVDINRNSITGSCSYIFGNVSENSIELIPDLSWGQTSIRIFELKEAESNPNAGKIIITTDGTYDFIYDAVYRFNRTDDQYFVRVIPNDYDYMKDIAPNDGLDHEEDEMNSRRDMGNRLMVDLMAGECPDVVFYTTQFPQLNNGNCMLDLTSFYEESDLYGKLFENIIDAARTDGKLYSMPLYFSVKGIMVDRRRYEGDGRGMTLQEFYDFTHDYCNGKNPIAITKLDFVSLLLEQNYDLFVKDGNVDLDNDEFRDILKYACENVNDVERGMSGDHVTEVSDILMWFEQIRSQQIAFDDADMIGYPSPDRRGPSAGVGLSVSITASSKVPEGAWRFVKMLLDKDCQLGTDPYADSDELVFGTETPVNKEAYEIIADRTVSKYNNYLQDQYDMMGWGKAPYVTIGDAETFRNIIGSIDHIAFSDSDLEVIIHEELQAYFAGDRSLDDTIGIMSSRARILFDETR